MSSSFQELEEEEESSEESEDEEFQLEDYPMLRKLDPKDWKVCQEMMIITEVMIICRFLRTKCFYCTAVKVRIALHIFIFVQIFASK